MRMFRFTNECRPVSFVDTARSARRRGVPDVRRCRHITKFAFLAVSCICAAGALAHPPEPSINLGDTSFLDGLGGPGLLLEEIGDGSHSGKTVDRTGQSISGAPAVNAVSGLTHIAWLGNRRLLGGWYGVEAVAVPAHVNAGSQGEAGGWGNLTLSPFILQWPESEIGRVESHNGQCSISISRLANTSETRLPVSFPTRPSGVVSPIPFRNLIARGQTGP